MFLTVMMSEWGASIDSFSTLKMSSCEAGTEISLKMDEVPTDFIFKPSGLMSRVILDSATAVLRSSAYLREISASDSNTE